VVSFPATAKRFPADKRGNVAIEAAVALPFLALLGSGIVEFGHVFYNYGLIQTGVRDSARYLSRVADLNIAEPVARNLAVTGSVLNAGTPRVSWWHTNQVQISYRQTPNPIDIATGLRRYRGNDPLTTVRVEAVVDYPGLAILPLLGFDHIHITAAHEERYVGQ
jgi:Flp pilus assembly protein TadG